MANGEERILKACINHEYKLQHIAEEDGDEQKAEKHKKNIKLLKDKLTKLNKRNMKLK